MLFPTSFWGGAINSAQPPVAKMWGFNTNTFFDDFLSLNTIDIHNTFNPGFNWYVTEIPNTFPPYGNTQSPGAFSVNNSILTFTSSYPTGTIGTAAYQSHSVTAFPGTLFSGAGYFEASIALSSTAGQIAFWMIDNQILFNIVNNVDPYAQKYVEIDMMEDFGAYRINVYLWNSNTSQTFENNPVPSSIGNPNLLQFHKYGYLIVPMAKNGGTGILMPYFDRKPLPECSLTYTASDPIAVVENSAAGYNLFLQCTTTGPIYVDYVTVWQ